MLFKSKTYFVSNDEMLNIQNLDMVTDCWVVLENYSAFKYAGTVADFFVEENNITNVPNEYLNWHCLMLIGNENASQMVIIEPDLVACIDRINDYLYPAIENGDKIRLN
jgi:hypothetical protein